MRNAKLNDYLPFPCKHLYTIYEDGRIHNDTNGKWIRGTSIDNHNRYVKIHLGTDEAGKFLPLHRLVAQIFIPNPNNYPQVNHIDGNRYNNAASNLEWCTAKQNIRHCWDTGLHKRQHGKMIGTSKLTGEEAKWVYSFRDSGLTPKQFVNRYRFYKINLNSVRSIWQGRSWARVTGHSSLNKCND